MADIGILCYPENPQIPFDLFVSKKHPGLTPGDLGFADSSGKLVYCLRKSSSSSSRKSLLDSAANTLFSIHRPHSGLWEGFSGDSKTEMVFKVKRTLNKFRKTELEVCLMGQQNQGEAPPDLKIKGCPFQKSCTIYSGDSIVAQTSLMYKLKQIYVGRSKFRLTIFPGSMDHALVVALVAIFLEGRK